MSFSSDTKEELSRIKIETRSEIMAELAAFVRMSGAVSFSGNRGLRTEFRTENAAVARRIFTFVKDLYGDCTEVFVTKGTQLKKNNVYLVRIDDAEASESFLREVGMLDEEHEFFNLNYAVPPGIRAEEELIRAYIRAAFLAAGSLTNPDKSYHLEWFSGSRIHAEGLMDLINLFDIGAKSVPRKENHVVYVKDSEKISDCLTVMGAVQLKFRFENIRVVKELRNDANRRVNCEIANIEKIVRASTKQVEMIEHIQRKIGLKVLPPELAEIAELRLENTDMSLTDLGQLLDPPLSKSAVNQRMRRLDKISREL